MKEFTASIASGQSTADTRAAVQSLLPEGKSPGQIFQLLGVPPKTVSRIRRKANPGTVIKTPAVEHTAPAATPKIKISKPQQSEDYLRERIATDEPTVPFSNWLGDGSYREAGEPQDMYETDQDGEQQLVGVKINPGVLWPDEWTGPKSVEDIYISPNVLAPRRTLKAGFILFGAQNKTPAHGPLVINMHALAAARGYDHIEIGPFTYGKSLFTEKKEKDIVDVAPWSGMIADNIRRSSL